MEAAQQIREKLEGSWIPAIYRDKVRTQRTRSYRMDIPEKENRADILHTLLGIELKVGKMRLSCPDLSTARYLRVFARAGCKEIALPYDITKIPALADEFESAWQMLLLLTDKLAGSKSPQMRGKLRSALIRSVRDEITTIGAGEMMPTFEKPRNARSRKGGS